MTLSPYLPIVGMFALALGFAVFSVAVAPLVGPRRYNKAKLDAYECGIEPTPQGSGGGTRFPVKFYLTAMLFIVFDIEIIFLYPWAVAYDALGAFGFVEMVLFIVTVLIA
ncbi:MAG: NADH-quinone oxidoreductase subunit A, partial [Micromonosporaceae bacterium]